METITAGGLTAARGEKVQGYVQAPGTEAKMPVTLIAGARPGKTALITGGIHSAEYVGIEAAIQLSAELDARQIEGNVMIISLVNGSGFAHRTMSMVYEDGKNLNREFPGKPDGTAADQICHMIAQEFLRQTDYYIDLHCGDGYEELMPYTYFVGTAPAETAEISRRMACHTSNDYVVASRVLSGGAYNYASSQGIPSILIERGCQGRWSQQEVEADKKDVKNVLRGLGILRDGGQAILYEPQVLTQVYYIEAAHTGCWYPRFHAGDRFQKGEVLGVVKDCFGQELETCRAWCDGMLLYQTSSLNVLAGGPMAAYANLSV